MKPITIEYASHGQAVSDFQLEEFVFAVQTSKNREFCVSTGNAISAILTGIAEESLCHEHVVFIYRGREIKANTYGSLPYWPRGFADMDTEYAERRLQAQTERKKREGNDENDNEETGR